MRRGWFHPLEWRVRTVRGLYFVECRRWLVGWCYITMKPTHDEAEEFIRDQVAGSHGVLRE